jgi:hypothetical protein
MISMTLTNDPESVSEFTAEPVLMDVEDEVTDSSSNAAFKASPVRAL